MPHLKCPLLWTSLAVKYWMLNGNVVPSISDGVEQTNIGQCLDDTFTVSGGLGSTGTPIICGKNSGDHGKQVYCIGTNKTLNRVLTWHQFSTRHESFAFFFSVCRCFDRLQ